MGNSFPLFSLLISLFALGGGSYLLSRKRRNRTSVGRWISIAFCALSILLLAPSAWAEQLLIDPVAPQGLENKHDYSTVDISTLNEWEKTFVPDARKEPILKHILSVVDWELKPGAEQAPYCSNIMDKLQKWEDVEIVEPAIRTNSYGDAVFSEWHQKCPGFIPHERDIVTPGEASPYYGTHHFKIYDFPQGTLKDGESLFYFQGGAPPYYLDGYGNKGERQITHLSGVGDYRIIDLEACKIVYDFRSVPAWAFSYPSENPKDSFQESSLLKVKGTYYVVGGNISPVIGNHFIALYRLSKPEGFLQESGCWFSSNKIQ